MSNNEHESDDTQHLLESAENARRLFQAIKQANDGELFEHDLTEAEYPRRD